MLVLAIVAGVLAALFHVMAFVLESVLFSRPATWRRFRVSSQRDADVIRPMALNQGFYNLFLAVGMVAGIIAVALGNRPVGVTLIAFAAACMIGAGVVLGVSGGRAMLRTAVLQAAFPLVAVVALAAA